MTIAALREAEDEASFGGKAVKLGAAMRAGLPVPAGFAISWDDPAKVLPELPPPLAVRSSAIGEDGAGASFAGQHVTLLGIRDAAELATAVIRVRDSAGTAAALAYRQRMGIAGVPRMGVVVQRIVDAEVAGVLFTRDPSSKSDDRVIEASWGLGESVVAGLVTPDGYRLDRGGAVTARRAGMKDLAVRLAPGGGTHEEEIDPDRAHAFCLDDGMLRALAELADRCEAAFGPGQDLEWAFAGGELFLLQWRPITT